MSKQLTASEVELENLLQSVIQELSLYDNLFPKVEDRELKVLLGLIRIYLARCDNPELRKEHILVNPELIRKLTLSYFDPFGTPINRSLREALVSRLSSIRKYNITRPEVVRRTLIACLYSQEKRSYVRLKKYLDAIMKNPGEGLTRIAEQLGVTPQAMSKAYRGLIKSGIIQFYGYVNYPMFKLSHFAVFFTPTGEYKGRNDFLKRVLFDSNPYALTLNLDVHEGISWASFAVPSQKEPVQEFKSSLHKLRGELFRDVDVRELRSYSTGSNLEFFDGRRWFFDPQLWAYGFFEFARENKELLMKPAEIRYSSEPIRFDKTDFLIAGRLSLDPSSTHKEIRNWLGGFGCDLSRASVSRRIERMVYSTGISNNGDDEKQMAVHPCMMYQGLGLNSLCVYLIECNAELVEEIRYAVGYLPFYFLYTTDKGVVLFIRSGAEDVGNINYVIRGINEISIVAYSNRFENIGTRNISHLYEKWDEHNQRWIFRRDELNFVKRYQTIPD